MNENLSYSFHIGNDKNKTTKAKQIAKDRPTNFNNNAIQNAIQLSKVNHHNLRVYENNSELINDDAIVFPFICLLTIFIKTLVFTADNFVNGLLINKIND